MAEYIDDPAICRSLHEALQDHAVEVEGERAIVTGWCMVAEWFGPDGNRFLSIYAGDGNASDVPVWTVQGWLQGALARTWQASGPS